MKQIEVVAAMIRKGDKIFATQRGYGEWQDWWKLLLWEKCQSVRNEGEGTDGMLTLLMENG